MKRTLSLLMVAGLFGSVGCMNMDKVNPWSNEPEIPEPITPPGSLDVLPNNGMPTPGQTGFPGGNPTGNFQPVGRNQPAQPMGMSQTQQFSSLHSTAGLRAEDINDQHAASQYEVFRQELERDRLGTAGPGYASTDAVYMRQ